MLTCSLQSQDLVFSQFENAPLNLNSALTGNFDGKARTNFNYRNQGITGTTSAAYKSGALSFDTKKDLGNNRTIGYGFSAMIDRAGSLNFGTNHLNFYASIIQNFGDVTKSHHSIAIGVGNGLDRFQFGRDKILYFDMSTGIVWSYFSNSRFCFQIGSSINHVNRPDISFNPMVENQIYRRVNVHGNVEIPIVKKMSLIPSFLYATQGPHEEVMFGLQSKHLFTAQNRYNPFSSMKFGLFGRAGTDFTGSRKINSYIFRLSAETKTFQIGLSYDYFIIAPLGAVEIMLGYKFGFKE